MAARTARKSSAKKKAPARKRAAAKKATVGKRVAKTARKVVRKTVTPVKKAVRKTSKAAKKTANKAAKAVKKTAATAVGRSKKTAAKAAKTVKRARANAARAAAKKDGRPPNWPALSPYMTVRDAEASARFYDAAFGFKLEGELMRDESGQIMHAGMRLGDACIMFAPQGMSTEMRSPAELGGPTSLSLYVYVPDVDALAERAMRAGAAMLQGPANQFWGDRIAIFHDPDGYHWTFATNVGEFDERGAREYEQAMKETAAVAEAQPVLPM